MPKKITISEEAQIERPASREMIPVEKCDWERIKRLIKKIDTSKGVWENSGWFMAATTIATFYEFVKSIDDKEKLGWGIAAIFCLLLTILIFIVSHLFSKTKNDSKEQVLDEMTLTENKIEKMEEKDTDIKDIPF